MSVTPGQFRADVPPRVHPHHRRSRCVLLQERHAALSASRSLSLFHFFPGELNFQRGQTVIGSDRPH